MPLQRIGGRTAPWGATAGLTGSAKNAAGQANRVASRFGRVGLSALGGLLLAALASLPPAAADAVQPDPNKAATSRAAEEAAIASIPFERLSSEAREKIDPILASPHLFRRMPLHVIPCDPDLYLFLVRHPDVVVGIWEVLGISDLRMRQISQGQYRAGEGETTAGTVTFLHQDPETHVLLTEGYYAGPLLSKPVRGRALVILKTGYVREPDGRYYITSRLDSFTQIDNATVEFLTRTLQPIVGKVADSNFVQTSAFVGSLSRTAEVNEEGVRRLAAKLERVRPEVRQQFAELAEQVAQRATRQASLQTPAAAEVAERVPSQTR